MSKYVCNICGWVYDEALGDEENGIAPGTAFADLPDDFVCPLCGVGKDDFSEEQQKFLTSIILSFTLIKCKMLNYKCKVSVSAMPTYISVASQHINLALCILNFALILTTNFEIEL